LLVEYTLLMKARNALQTDIDLQRIKESLGSWIICYLQQLCPNNIFAEDIMENWTALEMMNFIQQQGSSWHVQNIDHSFLTEETDLRAIGIDEDDVNQIQMINKIKLQGIDSEEENDNV
jgi:hypothetical protein